MIFIRANCFTSIKNLAIPAFMFMTLFIVLSTEITICSVLLFIHNICFGRRIVMTIFGTAPETKQVLRNLSITTC